MTSWILFLGMTMLLESVSLPLLVLQSAYAGSAITIIDSSSFTDSIGIYRVVGEVVNISDRSQNNIILYATLFDSSGRTVGTTLTFPYVTFLRSGEKSAFELAFTDPDQIQKISKYEIDITSSAVVGDKFAALIIKPGESYIDNLGNYHAVGQVLNNGTNEAHLVIVSGAFYDIDGKIVNSGLSFATPSDLEPGNTAPYDITLINQHNSKIQSISLNAQSQEYSTAVVPEFPMSGLVLAAAIGSIMAIVAITSRKSGINGFQSKSK